MKDRIKHLSERIQKTFEAIQTEEATKNAYIMPFLQLLGYDVFNPLEVVPEFTADVGLKKGEKVDYAIVLNGQPAILIECKDCRNELNVANESQLLRYFHTSKAQFAILTNGVIWKFFTDLAEPNKMDLRPFLEINILEPDKINYGELEKFCKEKFDTENIRKTADLLKCTSSIKKVLLDEFAEPSEDFLRLVFKKMETSASFFNEKQREKIKPLVKNALENIINEKVKASLDAALKTTTAIQAENTVTNTPPAPAETIVTTEDEITAFNIIKAIGIELVAPERIFIRDAKTYCAVIFDDNNRKPICRLYFNNPDKKGIGFFATNDEEKIAITGLDDIFKNKDKILSAIRRHLEK